MKLISGGSWMVDLTSASSFYPYGMEIPGRTWNNGTGYRYGWGGHEKDNEVKGDGNSIATHFRLNDPRTGRWFTMDPVTHFSQSPYVSMDADPINLFDPWGADSEGASTPSAESNRGNSNTSNGDGTGSGSGESSWLDKAVDIGAGLIEGLLSVAEYLFSLQDDYQTTDDYYSEDPAFNPSIVPDANIPTMALLGEGINEFLFDHELELIKLNVMAEGAIETYQWIPYASGVMNLAISQGWVQSSMYSETDGYIGLALTPAGILGNNLVRQGFMRFFGYAAHHIVPWGHTYESARKARKILNDFGIDINDASNGVFLRGNRKIIGTTANHSAVHTKRYMDEVFKRLDEAKTKEEAEFILRQIGDELFENKFPY